MSRPPLPVGTFGHVRVTEGPPGRFRARTAFRDYDGVRRDVEASGKTAAAAKRALVLALRDRSAPSGREVTPEMRLSVLGELWLEELALEERVRPQTIDCYRRVWQKHLVPAVGQLRVRETSVSRIDRAVRGIAAARPGQQRHARVVLSGVLNLAVRHDALASNPVRSISRTATTRKPVVALDLDTLEAVRRAVRDYRNVRDDQGRLPPGPRSNADLGDAFDLLLATGARPGEVLALRWPDVNLKAVPPTATISGTVVEVTGQGLVRQPVPKSQASHRTLPLPAFAVAVLLRRQVEQAGKNPFNAVFPSRAGTWRSPRNLARTFRQARAEAGLAKIEMKSCRATVATLINREAGVHRAAQQAGHGRDIVTETYYLAKPDVAPDSTAILEKLAPRSPKSGVSRG